MSYAEAQARFAEFGIDTEAAMEAAAGKAISIHCWQGDDLVAFDSPEGAGGAANGILATGNYPGRARNFEELKADFLEACRFIPGKKRINLHASYAIFTDEHPWVDRDKITIEHFQPWVDWARENSLGIDFNQTVYGHPMMVDGLSLTHTDPAVRRFWIDHCIACRKISQAIGEQLNDKVLCNLWIADGLKDVPADRFGPRQRLLESLDEIFAEPMPNVIDSVESKWFGIGVEAYTPGSMEFYTIYSATRPNVHMLMDIGHYHPSEFCSEKLPTLQLFNEYVPLHISRPMNWDSDHVVNFDDELREICKEIVRNGCMDKVLIGTDFFDASINRVAAWVIGCRSMQKALLWALLQPHEALRVMQDKSDFTQRMALMEEVKTMPFPDVWDEYCRRQGIPAGFEWYQELMEYEREFMLPRDEA